MEDFFPALRVIGMLLALTAIVSALLRIMGLDPMHALILGYVLSSVLMAKPSETES